jgi:NADP-dependent 3-hydroxy acid dehydrogenase YdfG
VGVALVTGASGGIGRAIALALTERGDSVWLVGRRVDALEEAATAAGGAARVAPADLTSDDDVERLRADLDAEAGRLDVLVHCAGTISHGPLSHADIADLDAQYGANVRAPYLLTQAFLPLLVAAGGDVVFVNSSIAGRARAGAGQFAATQAALKAIADSLRDEVNASGVRVLNMFPGRTATKRQADIHAYEGKDYRPEHLMQPQDVAGIVVSALALPRTAEVTEISMRPFIKPPA